MAAKARTAKTTKSFAILWSLVITEDYSGTHYFFIGLFSVFTKLKNTLESKEREIDIGSARQQQQSFLSFRSLSKLHLHCLLRWRAQFLEADAKAPKPTQICFFYYTRRQLFRCSVRSLAVLRRGELARAFFTVNTKGRGSQRVPHRKAFKSCSAFVGSAGCTSLVVVVFVQNALVTWLSPSKREVRHVRVTLLYAKQNEGDCEGVKLRSSSASFQLWWVAAAVCWIDQT